MKKYFLLILALFCILSCKQNSDHDSKTIQKVLQKYAGITEINYFVKQIWKGPFPGSVDTLSGSCAFIQDKNDTIIGAQYLLNSDRIFFSYDGSIRVMANSENKSAEISNLSDYSNLEKKNVVLSPALFVLSYYEIMNNLKERSEHNPNTIITLKDTVINDYNSFRIKIVEQDTIIDGNHNEIFITVVFDKSTLLPLIATKTRRTPGEVYKGQTIDAIFSQYEISTSATDKTYDLSSIPFQIQKLTYSKDKKSHPILKISDTAPQWSGTLINGDSISSKGQIGNLVLLDFTSVHCGACLLLNKVLNRIDEKYKNSNLTVISVYPLDKIEEIKKLTTLSSINHSSVYNATKMQKDYGVIGFPNLFLINQSGEIEYIASKYSEDLETELTKAIDKILIPK